MLKTVKTGYDEKEIKTVTILMECEPEYCLPDVYDECEPEFDNKDGSCDPFDDDC